MVSLKCRGSSDLPRIQENCSQFLINPTQHRRDDCQKHCHYGCYDCRYTFVNLEFDSSLFEQFFFCFFLLPFSQMACPPSVGFNQIVLFDYVYIITRSCVFVNRFTSQITNICIYFLAFSNLIFLVAHFRYFIHHFLVDLTINPESRIKPHSFVRFLT